MGKSKRLTYDFVKSEFEKRGYELLDTEYKNNSTPLRYKCPHHTDKELKIAYASLKTGGGCPHCFKDRKRLSIDFVKSEFEKRGYELLEDTYINSRTLMRYRCPSHSDKELKITYNSLQQGVGCRYCYYDSMKLSIEFIKKSLKTEATSY